MSNRNFVLLSVDAGTTSSALVKFLNAVRAASEAGGIPVIVEQALVGQAMVKTFTVFSTDIESGMRRRFVCSALTPEDAESYARQNFADSGSEGSLLITHTLLGDFCDQSRDPYSTPR